MVASPIKLPNCVSAFSFWIMALPILHITHATVFTNNICTTILCLVVRSLTHVSHSPCCFVASWSSTNSHNCELSQHNTSCHTQSSVTAENVSSLSSAPNTLTPLLSFHLIGNVIPMHTAISHSNTCSHWPACLLLIPTNYSVFRSIKH